MQYCATNISWLVYVLLKTLFTVDHAGYNTRIAVCISEDHSHKVKEYKTINGVLGEIMYLFNGPTDRAEKGDVFECQTKPGYCHGKDKKIKKDIAQFHPDIVFLQLMCFRQ
jgi:hypothetical protein